MSDLIVEVCKIEKVRNHPNADRLDIAQIKNWQCIIGKDEYREGANVIFVPPDSLIPSDIAEKFNVKNYLAGKAKNRVKSIKLRGEMSYGLILPNVENWKKGYDCAKKIGITKYEPPVRGGGMGDAAPQDPYFPRMTEIENIRNYPDVFKEGQMVAVTEKCDGTQSRLSISKVDVSLDNDRWLAPQEFYITDEVEGEQVFAIWKAGSNRVNRKRPETIEEMKKNTYWYPYTIDPVFNLMETMVLYYKHKQVELYGEVYGAGISGGEKSLNYGVKEGLDYRAFSLKLDGTQQPYRKFLHYCKIFGVKTVPVLDIIPYDFKKIEELSKGTSVLAGENEAKHIKEGVVIHAYEDTDVLSLKCLNPDYLLLKEKGIVPDFTDV